jgi:hypothetical protein
MSSNNDEKAFEILEKAVYKAQVSLEKTKYFQPFLMLMNTIGKIEIFENKIKDSTESYNMLENFVKESVKTGDVDIIVLAVDTVIPENFVKDIPNGIRLHLEEKSQIEKKIAARFLYVPYELCKAEEGEMYVKLHSPIAVGFPAEYLVK